MLRQTLDVMRTVQGISDYLELEGDPHAQNKIRTAVSMCLPAEKRLSTSEKPSLLDTPSRSVRTNIAMLAGQVSRTCNEVYNQRKQFFQRDARFLGRIVWSRGHR